MNLTERTISTILYEKEGGETSGRVIIPTNIPSDNITAIDVSDLTPDERVQMQERYRQYAEYIKTHMSTAYKFETWVEMTEGVQVKPKWRSFKKSGLK